MGMVCGWGVVQPLMAPEDWPFASNRDTRRPPISETQNAPPASAAMPKGPPMNGARPDIQIV